MTYNYAGSIEIYGNCVFILSFSGKCLFYNNNKKTMCSSRAIHRLFYDLFYHLKSTRIASSNSWIINQTSKYIFGCVGFIDQFACIFIFGMHHLNTSFGNFRAEIFSELWFGWAVCFPSPSRIMGIQQNLHISISTNNLHVFGVYTVQCTAWSFMLAFIKWPPH